MWDGGSRPYTADDVPHALRVHTLQISTHLRFFCIASSRLSLRIWIIPSSRLRRASSASVAFLKPFLRASVRDEGRSIVPRRVHESDGSIGFVGRSRCRRVALLRCTARAGRKESAVEVRRLASCVEAACLMRKISCVSSDRLLLLFSTQPSAVAAVACYDLRVHRVPVSGRGPTA